MSTCASSILRQLGRTIGLVRQSKPLGVHEIVLPRYQCRGSSAREKSSAKQRRCVSLTLRPHGTHAHRSALMS